MTDADALLHQPADASVQRDRYGRYLITPADGGKPVAHTRATTIASTLSDKLGLQQWALRMAAIGLTRRPDLFARVAATPADDKQALNRLVDEAKEAAAASAGANVGTALHSFTERLDRGEDVVVPEPWCHDVTAYRAALDAAGARIVDGMIERIVVLPDLGVAGMFDRLVLLEGRELPLVADLKSGGYLDWPEIVIQQALYANAATIYDPATRTHVAMPAVDRDEALIIHLPAGKATCELHLIDIAAGWEAVQQAMWVREWRKRKGLARPLTTGAAGATTREGVGASPGAPTPAAPAAPIVEANAGLRLRAGTALEQLAGRSLPAPWPEGIARFRDGGPATWPEVKAVESWVQALEARLGLPFVDALPIDPLADPPLDTFAEVKRAMNERLAALPEDIRNAVRCELTEAGLVPLPQFDDDARLRVNAVLGNAEAEAGKRRGFVASLLQSYDDELVGVLVAGAGRGRALADLRVDDVERLESLVAAIERCLVALTWDEAGAATLMVTDAAEAALLEHHGGRQPALREAQRLAGIHDLAKPRSFVATTEDPVLVALTVGAPAPSGEAA